MKGFEVIGLNNNYKIIKESADRLGGYPDKDRDKRQFQLEKLHPDFSDLDDKFYKSDSGIENSLVKYIKNNRKEFIFKGIVEKPKDF